MVKLQRGGKQNGPMVRARGMKPRPLFPPGELPLFGPPPAYLRRPLMPPPPPNRGSPMGYGPPPPMRPHPPPPPHPMGPPPPMMRHRPGPPPPMPLLQAPVMPRRPLPFMRGGRGGAKPLLMKPGRRLVDDRRMKPFRRQKKNKPKKPNRQLNQNSDAQKQQSIEAELFGGPWITDAVKVEIEKMNELKKTADEKKDDASVQSFEAQKKKAEEAARAAKSAHCGDQKIKPEPAPVKTNEANNGSVAT